MRFSVRLALAVALPLLILVIPALAVPASTITVCASGCDYSAIQPAIDAANPDDTIVIGADTYTEQLILKSQLTLIGSSGPTRTIVTASASPIVSGSQLVSVTLEGVGIQGQSISTSLGIDLVDSSLVLSNVIISDLHGVDGTPVYTNGSTAVGLQINGTFSVTLVNSTIEHISGGDAEADSIGRGGDGIGLAAMGDGQLTIISSTVRQLTGGAAGMNNDWSDCSSCCNGVGGRSLGINKEGSSNVVIEHTRIEDLVGGQPCTGPYAPTERRLIY